MFEFEGNKEGLAMKEVFEKSMERLKEMNRLRAEKIHELFPHLSTEQVFDYLTLEDNKEFRGRAEKEIGDIWNFSLDLETPFRNEVKDDPELKEAISAVTYMGEAQNEFFSGFLPLLATQNPKYLPQKGAVEFRENLSRQRALALMIREKVFQGDSKKFIEAVDERVQPIFMDYVFQVFEAQHVAVPAEWKIKFQRKIREHRDSKAPQEIRLSEDVSLQMEEKDAMEPDDGASFSLNIATHGSGVFQHFKKLYTENPTQFLDDFFGIKDAEHLSI
ncbi:MAG: hypothetical protein COV59_01695 [Candidatus Magasanikbacteria bacterium CG11_big_fil_rev_8_21_14_0_20_39_34]|uniref:Uncharacterized protein n=1 Tax=Candidatus Magasanikbacteria bacterium CG11_big_fil_rev_8_21_14_0_20_39_34 TaxID=1974653 RepID=A0A2H0N605_9BACT|nr:MAG: hypothetical protein COV59_01695 [Candidatus Magasanikbacteria bacterium CG11_big_fil_rev_8_21_14_0_20_39_34]